MCSSQTSCFNRLAGEGMWVRGVGRSNPLGGVCPDTGSNTVTAEVRCFGEKWAYRSVIGPKRLLTVASEMPRIMSQDAKVWRNGEGHGSESPSSQQPHRPAQSHVSHYPIAAPLDRERPTAHLNGAVNH